MAENWRVGDANGSPVEEFGEAESELESGQSDGVRSAMGDSVGLETGLDGGQGDGELLPCSSGDAMSASNEPETVAVRSGALKKTMFDCLHCPPADWRSTAESEAARQAAGVAMWAIVALAAAAAG